MKRGLALALALVTCLALCACGTSKYVGQYRSAEGFYYADDLHCFFQHILEIKEDGTFWEYSYISLDAEGLIKSTDHEKNYKEYRNITDFDEYRGSWEETDDGYLVLDYGVDKEQFKLEGVELKKSAGGTLTYTKIS